VLHIIDGLGGGGSERHVWEIVRLSDPEQVSHRVVTVFPDDGTYVYAERLRAAGAYLQPSRLETDGTQNGGGEAGLSSLVKGGLSDGWKRPLRPLRSAAAAARALLSQALASQPSATGATTSATEEAQKHERIMEGVYAEAMSRLVSEYKDFRPDVIHGHTFHGFSLGLSLKLMFHRPVVYYVPALFSQLADVNVGWLPEQYKTFHQGIDRFFTSYPQELLGIGVPAQKIVRMNVVVDLAEVARVQAERQRHRARIRLAAGISDDAPVALSVGRLHPSKGHLYALEAMASLVKQFPDLHWMVIGNESAEERAALERRARELGVERHMHLMGFAEEPLHFYAAADIYFRTPVFEAENLSSCQAMAMGLPAVGFAAEGHAELELIGKVGHGHLVRARDSGALAEAASRILSLPDRGRSLGERGAEYARAHLDFQHLISMLVDVYSNLHQEVIR
jgi:glycosyltransferase involved in cell wall biosynthesis